jgi:hypothetical protein
MVENCPVFIKTRHQNQSFFIPKIIFSEGVRIYRRMETFFLLFSRKSVVPGKDAYGVVILFLPGADAQKPYPSRNRDSLSLSSLGVRGWFE